jgi:Flp pilus assembly pilin Flp
MKALPHFTHTIARHRTRAEDTHMMMKLYTRWQVLKSGVEGQDLLEYALLVALIALVAVGAVTLAGSNVNVIFGRVATQLGTAAGS